MNEQKLISALSSINLWWKGEEVPKKIKKSENKRKIFYDLKDTCLKNDKIISISGPRQVGKTTLMGQLIENQIADGIDNKRIIYIPVDNELLILNSDNVLIDCLDIYFNLFLGETPEHLKSMVYVYLDEIQSLQNWAKQIKSYADSFEKIKFIISGSSHTKLYADASESLVGRINFRIILPFKFREFLEYYMPKRSRQCEFSSVDLRNALNKSIKEKNPNSFYRELTRLKLNISSELPQIKKVLEDYLIKGGYPGLLVFTEKDYDKALERIKTDLELTVYKDIHKIFNTRNSSELMSLLSLLSSSSGQKINYSRLSDSLSIDRRVVSNYINYTKLVYLVSESPFYKSNTYKKIEKMNKVYLLDNGHRNALLGRMDKGLLNEPESGLIIQTVVFNHISRLKFILSNYTNTEVCYWEDNLDNEVDIIMDLPIVLLPIEVKSKSGDDGVKAIYKFMEEHKKSEWGVIITHDELKLEKNILFVPLWALLLMC
ncbi:MAG: ATP-binding protein [Candidatus Nanoarchaeia archaeon]|nr:ATP-binding protein [Candidatus Nanoarchaeia archaeon]